MELFTLALIEAKVFRGTLHLPAHYGFGGAAPTLENFLKFQRRFRPKIQTVNYFTVLFKKI